MPVYRCPSCCLKSLYETAGSLFGSFADRFADLDRVAMVTPVLPIWRCNPKADASQKSKRQLFFKATDQVDDTYRKWSRVAGREAEGGALQIGGEAGIRTLDTAFRPYNGLANRRLQPLGHLTAHRQVYVTKTLTRKRSAGKR